MPTELEQRLRDSLDHAARRFAPPADLRDRVEAHVASRHRHARLLVAAGVVVVLVATGGLLLEGGDDQRVAVVPSAPGGGDAWVAATDPALNWHFEHPRAWMVQRFFRQCRVAASGTIVTNLDRSLHFADVPKGCTTAWDLSDVPGDFVAVQMSHLVGGPAVAGDDGGDTPFPLSLDQAEPGPPPPGGHPAAPASRSIQVSIAGDGRYVVRVWTGPEASPEDVERAERVVASIRAQAPPPAREGEAPLTLGYVPSGFGLVEDIEHRRPDDRVRIFTWAREDGGQRRSFEVHRQVGNPLDLVAEIRLQPGAEATTVQGHQAVVVRQDQQISLSWLGHDEVTLSVSSGDLGEPELRRVAEGVVYRAERDDLSLPDDAAPVDPGDGNRRLGPKTVVAQGEVEGIGWQLLAYRSDSGLCVDLRFGRGAAGGCGHGVGAGRAVSLGVSSYLGFRFAHGVARSDVAAVRVELSNGDTLNIATTTAPGFDVAFIATPLPRDATVASIVARDDRGRELQELPG
ncbi:MAG: hypothetical protein M3P85_03660 [Actinomycetota bacterium]|nr:hypothetical protein [Actinomycetota bacterium]